MPRSMPVESMAARVWASGRVMRMVIRVPVPSASNLVSIWLSGVGSGKIHPLHVDDPAEGLELENFTGDVEAAAFAVCPLVTELAARLRIVDADGHGPAFRTEQPLLD